MSSKDKKRLLELTREIDLCAKLGEFFGPNAYLAAQGTNAIDIKVKGPTLQAEVKYFRPSARQWTDVRDDWDWLIELSNNNNNFDKNAWLVFFPSTSLYKFTKCLSVTKTNGTQFNLVDYAPFLPIAQPIVPPHGKNEQLQFKSPEKTTVLAIHGGRKVRVDIISKNTHPIWCAMYTRITPEESTTLENGGVTRIALPANA